MEESQHNKLSSIRFEVTLRGSKKSDINTDKDLIPAHLICEICKYNNVIKLRHNYEETRLKVQAGNPMPITEVRNYYLFIPILFTTHDALIAT